jgi:hypothetical protein
VTDAEPVPEIVRVLWRRERVTIGYADGSTGDAVVASFDVAERLAREAGLVPAPDRADAWERPAAS